MRLLPACLLLILLVPTGSCVRSQNAQSHKGAFFNSGGDLDSKVRSLQRAVGYSQSKLGISAHDFEFGLPQGRKLEATFVAELDGKPVPELSGTWHIPPSDNPDNNVGSISVFFFDPPYNDQAAQSPIWELNFQSASGSGHSFTARSPFSPPKRGGNSASVDTVGLSSVAVDTEYRAWEYHAFYKPDDPSGERPYDFKYVLNIKMTEIKEGEKLERVKKIGSSSDN